MKKYFISLFFILFTGFTSFAVIPPKFDLTAGFSSGIPVYEVTAIKNTVNKLENPNRFIIGTYVNANINPVKYVTFFTGADLLTDFFWNSDITASLLCMDFPLGLKIYPFGGFNFGLAYTLGFCGMMIKDENGDRINDTTPWGNGFKLFMEYDFSRITKSKHYPILGASWNLMPRGNQKYDNLFVFYLGKHL